MSLRERHHDVAAYALGVLEPGDALACEEHLRGCGPCAKGLAGFAVTVSALAQLAGREALVPPGPEAVRHGPARGKRRGGRAGGRRVGSGRRPRGARPWAVGVAGAAAVLALAVPGAALLSPDGGPAGPRRASAADAATGVAVEVSLWDREWGTDLALRVTGVRTSGVCELFAVRTDGEAWPVTSWSAAVGYEPLVEAGTAMRLGDIDRLEVRTADGGRLLALRP
ncbi:zf-HC2 domain-containing protein [Streptomyces sp. NPDC047097]|uniref:anti-sigma factor family protein n=1 Tax=Streptomyces sp. NPDC047097 TaxID=3155260 RepID=UPI0033CF6B71